MKKDLFDRISLDKDIFDRIKDSDLFDRIKVQLDDILEKKLELSDEVKTYIRKQIENVADEIIQKNVARIKVDSLTRQDVKSLVETGLKGTAKENEVEEEIEKAKKEIKEEVEKLLKELRKKNAAMMNDFYSKSGNFYQFGGYRLTVTEEDGTPSGIPTTLKFSNGTVTNNGDGSFSISSGAGSSNSIQQLDADPVSPNPEEVWVRKNMSISDGSPIGLLLALTYVGTLSYDLSYRTLEGTTKRVSLT